MRICFLWPTLFGLAIIVGIPQWCAGQDRTRDRQRDETSRGVQHHDADVQQGRLPGLRIVPPRPDRHWRLGVEVTYTDHGAQITSVDRRSPASRAGLETRDVIVTVNGYQVGRVNGLLYTLDRELHLRADRFGEVRLLVQDRRNGNLAVLPVRLERAGREMPPPRVRPLTGTVTSKRITQLPRAAVLLIRLVDTTDRRLTQTIVAQKNMRDLGPLPIPFDLDYDPARIKEGHTYALEAQVLIDGLTTLRTRSRYPVVPGPRQERVQMILERRR